MAVCNTCGTESKRILTTFKGNASIDQCPQCSPETFQEKFKSVRDGEITMGWEFDPSGYKLKDGTYVLTDERRQDLEDSLAKPDEEGEKAYRDALEKKRALRRTKALSPEEIEKAKQLYA